MLISVCWDWALALGSTRSSSCLAAEVHFNGVVWLVASCWQMLIVFAWIGLWHWAQLGRQAAWRPRCILNGVVWLVASCWKMLISVCWDWALDIGLDSVVKLLGDRGAKPSSCLAEEIQLLVERLGSLLSLCHQAAWWL